MSGGRGLARIRESGLVGEEPPFTGNAFEWVEPAVLELKRGPDDEIPNGLADENLPSGRAGLDPGRDVHRHTADVVAATHSGTAVGPRRGGANRRIRS